VPRLREFKALNGGALIDKLRGGDRRSIGRSEEVVADVLAEPDLVGARQYL
jgi:hypothetical protein